MSGSYDDALPTDRDKIRAILGDTNAADWLHSDAHIDAVLTWQGGIDAAVAFLARELIARYARQPVVTTALGETVNYSDRLRSWQRIVDRADAGLTTDSTGSGGIVMVSATYGATATTDDLDRTPIWWP